ncbi:hypothetical protein PR202_ga05476 [Eleusine coracana subsp. coracana]|uniref:Uncharacterized protein n=1 Tax=Eleusine coracana subsp. coracana TaxID=191504 RepID=A0AAV5BU53_ELECO|nr:hypothetical protein PR202_ga05023 [Eleusine coracana subsp. coracana]GJM89299.1 hypothetical protein PR202_ga05476 [Eleusine coracana subsp. coracana]
MNDADVGKQIQQMVRFILQEAEEKASEITVAAEEEFNIEKLQLVESEKKRVRQEYDRKEKQVDVRRKIEYSTELNAARIEVLQAQDGVVTRMKESAGEALLRVTKDANSYKKVLKSLIVQLTDSADHQSLLRMREPSLVLRCREADRGMVEAVLEAAKKEYAEKAKVNLPKVIIDGKVYLPPYKSTRDAHGPSCSGGIVLASHDGKIVCDNTLHARLNVSFRQKLPEVRDDFLLLDMLLPPFLGSLLRTGHSQSYIFLCSLLQIRKKLHSQQVS